VQKIAVFERATSSTRLVGSITLLFGAQFYDLIYNISCGPFDATNASKHSINQSENKILQINQSKNASKHS